MEESTRISCSRSSPYTIPLFEPFVLPMEGKPVGLSVIGDFRFGFSRISEFPPPMTTEDAKSRLSVDRRRIDSYDNRGFASEGGRTNAEFSPGMEDYSRIGRRPAGSRDATRSEADQSAERGGEWRVR